MLNPEDSVRQGGPGNQLSDETQQQTPVSSVPQGTNQQPKGNPALPGNTHTPGSPLTRKLRGSQEEAASGIASLWKARGRCREGLPLSAKNDRSGARQTPPQETALATKPAT